MAQLTSYTGPELVASLAGGHCADDGVDSVSGSRRTAALAVPEISLQVATTRTGVPHRISFSRWSAAAWSVLPVTQRPRNAAVSIRVVGAAESRRLNRTWRGMDKPTNVLSFPLNVSMPTGEDAKRANSKWLVGDIVICARIVAREAREQSKELRAHWAHMVIHGVLHLLGYDHIHAREATTMEALEIEALRRIGFPSPYGV